MLGDPDLSVGSPNDIRPDWQTFECPNCGDVEDIDVSEALAGVTVYPCAKCGATLQPIDKE